MAKSKKRRRRDDESQAVRTAKTAKSKKRRRRDDEHEGEEEGGSIVLRQEFIARRLEGGAPATPEAYARAIDQWQQLPGAIVSRMSATSIRSSAAVPKPTIDTEKEKEPA